MKLQWQRTVGSLLIGVFLCLVVVSASKSNVKRLLVLRSSETLAATAEGCNQASTCCLSSAGGVSKCPHLGGVCCPHSSFCCPPNYVCGGTSQRPSCTRASRPDSDSSESSESSSSSSASTCSPLQPKCRSDWIRPKMIEPENSCGHPKNPCENSNSNSNSNSRTPTPSESSESSESSSADSSQGDPSPGSEGSASASSGDPLQGIANLASRLPPGVTVTSTKSANGMTVTTTISKHGGGGGGGGDIPPAPGSMSSESAAPPPGSSSMSSESSAPPPPPGSSSLESSAPRMPSEASAAMRAGSTPTPAPALSESSVPSEGSSPSESSGPCNSPSPCKNGKLKIKSEVNIAIGGKKRTD